jgi:hypothetical protein
VTLATGPIDEEEEDPSKISNFMKIRAVGAELFHADRRTDVTKVIVAFRNFENAPENGFKN